MKISFLGGASEVGASSIHIETGDASILIDCGIKYSGAGGGMPCLSMLDDRRLDAILVTHAHLDHTGALPIVKPSFPNTPVYMTPPTIDLVSILLKDSLKIMNSNSEREGEIPLYTDKSVAMLLNHTIPVGYCAPVRIPSTQVWFTFYPAGHILGAAMILLETQEGSVVITGDYSVQDQITVPGARKPDGKRRIVISESTYGNRLHSNRNIEEKRLAKKVSSVIENKGNVLIPAFALGRAQEVILLLKRAMKKNIIPQFPVFVDGMIRSVCHAYSGNASFLSPALKRNVKKYSDPFFGELDNFVSIASPSERKKVLNIKGCCIISSSGMLTGGPSQFYASQMVENPDNLIAITGYQDEEAPGRLLLNAMNNETIKLGDEHKQVNCRIEKYSLSAHAGSNELTGFICGLKPSTVLLVHGDDDARNSLADLLAENRTGRIKLPDNGDEIHIEPGRPSRHFMPIENNLSLDNNKKKDTSSSKNKKIKDTISLNEPNANDEKNINSLIADITDETILLIKQNALNRFSLKNRKKSFSVHQLFTLFLSLTSDNKIDPDIIDHNLLTLFSKKLIQSQVFSKNQKYGHILQISEDNEQKKPKGPDLLGLVDNLPKHIRILKRGLDHATKEITVNLCFPIVHTNTVLDILKKGLWKTDWGVRVNSSTHVGELKNCLNSILLENNIPGLDQAQKVSVFNEKRVLQVKTSSPPAYEVTTEIRANLMEMTGFDAVFIKTKQAPRAKRVMRNGKFEINAAFTLVESLFTPDDRPYKKSRKTDLHGEFIELSFITPEIGIKNKKIITQLAKESGWRIEINRNPNQDALKNLAKEMVMQLFTIPREPSFFPVKKQVRVFVDTIDDSLECSRIEKDFFDKTFYSLEIIEN